VFCHGIVEVGLVGVLVHVPDGVVICLDLSHAVHAETEGDQRQNDENKLEKMKIKNLSLFINDIMLKIA
jgi:hypothetical protein